MKTFLLIYAIMVSPMQQLNWDYVSQDLMTAKECGMHVKSLVDNTIFNHFDKENKVVLFKLPSNDTLVLTCFDTAEKTYVNHN